MTSRKYLSNKKAVEARGLVKVFGNNRAVDSVDLSIPTGCIYALLGPNGAGKTLFFRWRHPSSEDLKNAREWAKTLEENMS